jgi:hypothetical protein
LGYWKHPPLPWLLLDIIRRIFGSRLWPFFLLGQLAAAVACWATWRLGRELFTPLEAFVAVVILGRQYRIQIDKEAGAHVVYEVLRDKKVHEVVFSAPGGVPTRFSE